MDEAYHRAITSRALEGLFSLRALDSIITGNLGQDTLIGQIGHDEYHFDNNAMSASLAYIEACRAEVRPALAAGDTATAWLAFGRLTHSVQDFYAHTNYITLWLERYPHGTDQATAEVDSLDPDILSSPELKSGRLYYPLEILAFVPFLKRFIIPLLPHDSHAWMNIDSPSRPGYAYAEAAAIQRTRHEFFVTTQGWPQDLRAAFMDLHEV